MKNYIIILFLIFIIIPITFFPNLLKQFHQVEHFTPNEDKLISLKLTKNKYSFEFNNQPIDILPQTVKTSINFKYSIPLNFKENNSLSYLITNNPDKYNITLSFSENPITIVVNDHDETIYLQKAKTGHSSSNNGNTTTFNIVLSGKSVGNVKTHILNNKTQEIKLKTARKEIYNSLPILTSIFTGLLLFDEIKNLENIDFNES